MKQSKPVKRCICLWLAVLMLATIGIPMEAIAMTQPLDPAGGATSAVDLNGTWDFTPDTEARAVVIDACPEEGAAPLAALSQDGTEVRLTLDDPTAVRYGKIMALIQVGPDAAAPGGSLTLSAKVNGGQAHPLSLEGMEIGRKIWAELPLDPSDLTAGENIITLSSTAAAGQGAGDSVMLYGTSGEEGERYCVRIKYYPEIPSGWQDMTVPGAWEGNFTLIPSQEEPVGLSPALCVTINEDKGQLIDLEPYKGQESVIEIPLSLSDLEQGVNTFRFSSNVTAGPGQYNDTSVDIPFYTTIGGMDVTGSGFYDNNTFVQATTNVPAVSLMLKKADGEWTTVQQHVDERIGNVVVGLFADNGHTYEIQSALNAGDLAGYTEAKLMATVHVGNSIVATSEAEDLLPENRFTPAMCMTVNETNAQLVDLTPYMGQSAASIEIPLPVSALQQGTNAFRFNTNIANGPGQRNANSVDIPFNTTIEGMDVTGSGFYDNDAFVQATTNVPAVSLMLKKEDGEWDTVQQYTAEQIGSVVVGLLTDNGHTYEIQAALNVDDPSLYTEAKVIVSANVGANIFPNAPADSLIPETVTPVELKVSVNGGEEVSYDVTSQLGTVSLVDIALDYASLQTGDNTFALNSNTISHGQGQTNPASMDIVMATPSSPTGEGTGFWSDGVFNQFSESENFHITLLLQRADTDEWVEVKAHQGDNVNNLIVGKLGDNGVTYRPQVVLPVDDIGAYKAVRLQVMLHIGGEVERIEPQPDTPYDDAASEPIELGDPVLRVGVNSTDSWESYNLKSYAGGDYDLVVPVPVSSLQSGDNEFYFHSNAISKGNRDQTSVDLLVEPAGDIKDSAYSEDGLNTYTDLGEQGNRFKVGLALKRKDTGEWVEARTYSDDVSASLVVGKFSVNGRTYIPRVTIAVDDPSLYSDAVVLAGVHVGSQVEVAGSDSRTYDGVGWYRRSVTLPAATVGEEQWLHFEAIDYKAEIFLNGCFLGSHEGGYAPFDLPLSALGDAVRYGGENELVIRVTDQSTDIGSETIPIKETPAGFLQDTIGINYAGIWGDVSLVTKGAVYSDHLYVDTDIENGVATLSATVYNPTDAQRTVTVAGMVTQKTGEANGTNNTTITLAPGAQQTVSVPVTLTECTLWQIDNPHLYTASLTLSGDGIVTDTLSTDFGMRRVERDGNKIVFNGESIFLTGWITWEVEWDTIAPIPSVEQVEQRIEELKEAGFNAIKFCLVVPPDYVLDICDRMGIYCYIQYPIWEPIESEEFFTRCYLQLPELVEKDRNHPSVILSDFACELPTFSTEMDAFMKFMVEKAKELDPNRLFADNSSTGTNRYGDFRTTHPYVGVNEFDDAIDRWVSARGNYPLVLGEYADSRTMSNRDEILEACGGTPWWWTTAGTPPDAYAAFEAQGFSKEEIDQFKDYSYLSSLEAKRAYIEDSKKNSSVAALFLTQLVDIKHNSCGFYDELGNLKFDPAELVGSAGESALLIDDMAHNFAAGKTATITPAISHYNGKDVVNGTLTYTLTQGETVVLSGTAQENISLSAGDYYCFDDLSFLMPDCTGAQQYQLTLTLECDSFTISNHWDVWGYSTHSLRDNQKDVRYYDPDNTFDFGTTYPWMTEWTDGATPDAVITTTMTDGLNAYLSAGGQVIYLGAGTGPVASVVEQDNFTNFTSSSLIFFPDETHPLVEALSSNGYGGIQFLDLATQYFLPYSDASGLSGTPIFGRLAMPDARLDSYLSEYTVGSGRLLQCTLRLDTAMRRHGGDYLGRGVFYVKAGENPLGAYLIDQMLRYVAGDENEAGVSGLSVTAGKTAYAQGEALDLSSLTVTMTDTLGGSYPVSVDADMISGYDPNTLGEQTVTVAYEGKTATFTVTVLSAQQIERQEAIDAVAEAIDAIGEVTEDNLKEKIPAIEQATAAMDSLKEQYGEEIESEVPNAAALSDAIAAYDGVQKKLIENLSNAIDAIGDITIDNLPEQLPLIEAAEDAKQQLVDTFGETALESIPNLTDLDEARAEYDRLYALWSFPYGDIDDNDKVDAADALLALQHSVELSTLTGDAFQAADVNGNNRVDATDALYILQHSVELIPYFPVQQ